MIIMYPICCQQTRITRPQKPYLALIFSARSYRASTPLKISCQMYPSTMPPMRLGMKKTVRKMLVPGISWVRMLATPKARTLMRATVTRVKRAVNQKAWRNSLSWKARMKFPRPMNWASVTVRKSQKER